MDRYNKLSNTWYYENMRFVNPCGEQGLPQWGVCNLGALNLSAFVDDGKMDWERLADKSKVAMRFLDNVVDANEYFIKENQEAQLSTRRTGLGTMGLADALIKMQIPYGSQESIPVIERIYATIRDAAYDVSADIAAEKGSFPKFDRNKYMQGQFIKRLPKAVQEKISKQGIRNAVLLTQPLQAQPACYRVSVLVLNQSMTSQWFGVIVQVSISCIIPCSRPGATNILLNPRPNTL